MTKTQANTLVRALVKRFGGKAEFEPINGRGRYRFAITSKRFSKVPQLKRQDQVWEVVDEVLPRDAILDVSLILAFDPADLVTSK